MTSTNLSARRLKNLNRDGFIILPELFSESEIDTLNAKIPELWAQDTKANIREKNSNEIRMAMAVHQRDEEFSKLVHDPRLINPAYQIRPEPLYVQQVKVNNKAPLSDDVWQWHCDFGNHNVNDGIRRPLALNIHVYLDDVNQFNGPICFIPGSHLTENRQVASHEMFFDDQTTSYAVWAVDEAVVQAQVQKAQQIDPQQGIVAAMGKKGTALIFFDTTIHCSPANFSPWKRSVFSMILNPVSNAYGNTNRPDYLHHRDLTPVEAGSGDLL